MSSLFNFLKRLFSSIFGIFGGKKSDDPKELTPQTGKRSKSGYYLELDDSQRKSAAESVKAAAAAPIAAAKDAVKTVKDAAPDPIAAAKDAVKTVKDAAPDPIAAAKNAVKAVTKEVTPTESKSDSPKPASSGRQAKLAANAESPKPKAAPKAAQPAVADNGLNLPQPTVTTFAPNYLTPKATATRRRPGANMNSFLDMARQVKTQN